jgi:hypothetical protein
VARDKDHNKTYAILHISHGNRDSNYGYLQRTVIPHGSYRRIRFFRLHDNVVAQMDPVDWVNLYIGTGSGPIGYGGTMPFVRRVSEMLLR